MRVAHLVDTLHPADGEYGLSALAGAAAGAGLELVVIALTGSEDRRAEALRAAGAVVVEEGLAPWDPRAVPALLDTLREHRAELVHTHAPNADVVGAAAGTRLRIPVFSTLHRIEEEPAGRLDRLRRAAKTTARARFVTRTIAVSRLQVDWYRRVAGSAHGLVVLPDGVTDPAPLPDRARTRAALQVGADDVLVVSAAPMRRGKGQDLLLDAVAALPEDLGVRVVLTGDGPLRPWLEARVGREEELTGRVTFRPLPDPAALLQAADLQVHVTRTDVMPTAAVRGLAAGIPAVTSRTGGLPEIVTRETGRTVPLDADAVAEAVAELAADPGLRGRLGEAARARYLDRFEAGGWAERLCELYASTTR